MTYRVHIYYFLRETFYTFRQYGCLAWCCCRKEMPIDDDAGAAATSGTLNEIIFEPVAGGEDDNNLQEGLLDNERRTPQVTML